MNLCCLYFQSSQQAVNSLKNEGIKPEFMSNELVDAAENVFALDKKFNSIDKKINKNSILYGQPQILFVLCRGQLSQLAFLSYHQVFSLV